ncbi:MAG: beta-galactosidase [Lentisphaeria bacterium]|nr:beta-galactosidase [Lentisphaeria bacterium]
MKKIFSLLALAGALGADALPLSAEFSAPRELKSFDKVVSFQKWNGAEDLSAQWRIRADGSGVHFKITVRDDIHCKAAPGEKALWTVDGIQLGFAAPDARNCQVEICVYTAADGKAAYHFFTPEKETFRKCNVKINDISNGKEYLISVPWQSLLPLNPFEAKKFRANFIVNDNDGQGRKGYIELAKGIGESKWAHFYPVFDMPSALAVNGKSSEKFVFVYPAAKLLDPAKKSFLLVYSANMPEFSVGFDNGKEKKERTIGASQGRITRRFVSLNVPAGAVDTAVTVNGKTVATRRVVNLAALKERYGKLAHFSAQKLPANTDAARRQAVIKASLPTLKQFIDSGLSRRAERNLTQLEAIAAEKQERALPELARQLGCGEQPSGTVTIGDGWFLRGGRPVWLSGYNGFIRIHSSYGELRKMGTPVMALDINGNTFIREDAGQDKTPDLQSWFRGMKKHDLLLFAQVPYHYLPKWLYKKYPEGRVANTFWHFSCFHPAAKEVESRYLERGAAAFAPGAEQIPFVNLTNEPFVFDFSDTGKYARIAYQKSLQKKYKSLRELNTLYGTAYRDFSEIPIPWTSMSEPDFSKVSFAAWVDYLNFRREAIADFFLWMNRKWRSVSKIPVTHKLLGGSFSADAFIGHAAYRAGIDFETILRDSDLAGHDLGMGYLTVGREEVADSGDLLVNFYNHHFGVDLLRSLSGGKVLVNTENHLVPNARPDLHYSAELIQTMVFGQMLHGLAGHTFWVYENIQTSRDLSDTALSRPSVLLGISEITKKINDIMPLAARSLSKPQVAVYYSWPSMIAPSRHFQSALEAHKSLLFRGLDIGFISERMLAKEDFKGVKLLICADAPRFDDAAAAGLRKFIDGGGKVLFYGDNFSKDHYDRPKKFDHPNIRRLALGEELRKAVTEELRKLNISPALSAADGSELTGVEWKCVPSKTADGRKYNVFLIVNWRKTPVTVKFPAPGVDLLTGRKYAAVSTLASGMIGAIAVAE